MKKLLVITLIAAAVISMTSCTSQQNEKDITDVSTVLSSDTTVSQDTTADSETDKTDDTVVKIETPYAVLCVPKDFEGNVVSEVAGENPYTVSFKADGTELFTLIFNGEGEILMGTLPGEKENTVIRMNVPALDKDSEKYDLYRQYQDGVNTIMEYLERDYGFLINQEVMWEDKSTFDIKTSVVTLKYPAKWKDKVTAEEKDGKVSFSADGTALFDLCFAECENGFLLGTYKGTPIYVVDYETANDEYREMKDDLNVIIENLTEDSDFVMGN